MAKDIFHQAVRVALEKEGWSITHDPYTINIPEFRPKQDIDLGAEKMFAAERGLQKIAVEVKSFLNPSLVYDFHTALGQYMNYLIGLRKQEPERILYLAIPSHANRAFESLGMIIEAIETYHIRLIVYDASEKMIVSWKN
ncbi:element excision factor XisH family protein [Runella limosa]|uniref:element excision factor XisH family protein n=1 Tax=Runella limosa TaxID=370978 RepID=UPI0004920F0E|nr:element excision factor XisH family protein [Runella limosa]